MANSCSVRPITELKIHSEKNLHNRSNAAANIQKSMAAQTKNQRNRRANSLSPSLYPRFSGRIFSALYSVTIVLLAPQAGSQTVCCTIFIFGP